MAKNVVINGVQYQSVPSVTIPKSDGSGSATFLDTGDADVVASDVLAGKAAYNAAGKVTGAMNNNGAVTRTIDSASQSVVIPAGYHDGNGNVSIDANEQAKLVPANIKAGVTVLGVSGSNTVVDTSDADADASTILSGKTAYICGSKVTGTMTAATVSQDSVSKVLSIS